MQGGILFCMLEFDPSKCLSGMNTRIQPAVRLAEIAPSMTLAIGSSGSRNTETGHSDFHLRFFISEECAKVIYG